MQAIEKKITANSTIINLINFANTGRQDLFYKSAEEYVETLSVNGDVRGRMKRLLNEKPGKVMQLSDLPNNVKNLISISPQGNDNLFLNHAMKLFIDELSTEWKHAELFRSHNLGTRNRILLHGPTGNGKTTIAKHMAKIAGIPFVEVNCDNIVDSKVGGSAQNINILLRSIKEPCVLFWDEIDSVGKKRSVDDSSASTENSRIVNSILVNIEKMSEDTIFIAATNRMDILDPAFLRRFNSKIEVPDPSDSEKVQYINSLLEFYKLPAEVIPSGMEKKKNLSEIKVSFIDAARQYIIKKII